MRKQSREIKPHARQDLIAEQLRIGGSLSLSEIVDRLRDNKGLEFQRKTIERDIQAMSSTYGLIDDDGHPKRYSIIPDSNKKHIEIALSEKHLQILSMALTSLKTFSSLKGLALEAEKALLSNLPDDLHANMADSNQAWVLQLPQGGKKKEYSSDTIDAVLQALRTKSVIRGMYGSKTSGNLTERLLAPVKVEISGSGLWILARDLKTSDQGIKRFVPARFQDVKVESGHSFDVASTAELKPFFKSFGGFGGPTDKAALIRLVVGASVGEHLKEVEYHPSQRIKAIADGKFEVTLEVPIAWPVVRMIASFGGDVDSIEPTMLKERVYDIWHGGQRAMKRVRGA